MHTVRASAALVSAYLAVSARALPQPLPSATYSVVNVGGPNGYSMPATASLVETIIESPAPKTVTESPVTVTMSESSEQTVTETQRWTVTFGNSNSASIYTEAVSPVPTVYPEPIETGLPVVAATDTVTVYQSVPLPPFTIPTISTFSTSTTSSTSFKGPFPTTWGQWNHTVISISGPAHPTGTGTTSLHSGVA